MDGTTRYFDLSNPEAPKQTYEKVTGKQVNMISQSWDGKRVYITSSLLANWDKGGADNEQFLRGFTWDGKELKQVFEVDFTKEKLGRAHHMKLGSKSLQVVVRLAAAALLVVAGRRRAPALAHEPAPLPALDFEPPAPGTYTLHRIMAAPDGEVLGVDGRAAAAVALHARAHHAARVHLHHLRRSRRLPARVSGLRRR